MQKDILQLMRIGVTNSNVRDSIFDIKNVLEGLGAPEKIFIALAGPPLMSTIVLVYNEKGVLLRYQARFKDEVLDDYDKPLPICFSQDHVDLFQVDAWVQNPENEELVEANQSRLC